MSKLDEYRTKAENCERLAQKAKDLDVKESLQEAARSWRKLEPTERDRTPHAGAAAVHK